MAKVRTFIAVALPAEVRKYLDDFRAELAETIPERAVRWVESSKIHLTLRFLGDTDTNLVPNIMAGMDQLSSSREPFDLTLGTFDCFPNRRRPRVLWVGVDGQLDDLQTLYHSVEELLETIGWEPERRTFHPHLTLGRVKDSRRLAGVSLNWGQLLEPRSIPVSALHLIESRLYPDGPVYTSRHTTYFKKKHQHKGGD
jgi:2'-5' RNA ligase